MRPISLAVFVDFFPGEVERLRVGKIKRRWEVNSEIVAEPILSEWFAVAVCNLTARRRNIEDVSARKFLRLKLGTIVSSSACGGVVASGTADGASAWANNEDGVPWIENAIHKPPKVPQNNLIRKESVLICEWS